MKYITVNKDLIRIPQSKSANMEVLLLYYIRTKCNKECASAIGEKKMQEELNLSESTVEGYIGKLKEYKSILSIKTLNPNNEEDKKEIDKEGLGWGSPGTVGRLSPHCQQMEK